MLRSFMNKVVRALLYSLPFLFSVSLTARLSEPDDYSFNQERMIVDHGEIFIISTFDNSDGVTVYNFNGQRLWEVSFHAKIVSWNIQPDVIILFSKDRKGGTTYLTCLSRTTGRMLWERP
jgi:outer membrane protein assembly factor BamB